MITTNPWIHPRTGQLRYYINFEEWAPAAGVTTDHLGQRHFDGYKLSRAKSAKLRSFKVWADENGKITVDYYINFYAFNVDNAKEFAEKLEAYFAENGGLDFLIDDEEDAEPTAEELEIAELKAKAEEVAPTHEEGATYLEAKAEAIQTRINDRRVIFPEDGLYSASKDEVAQAERIFIAQYKEEMGVASIWEAMKWIEEDYRPPMDKRGPSFIRTSYSYAVAAYAKTLQPNPALVDWVDYESEVISQAVEAIENWDQATTTSWRGRRLEINADFFEDCWHISVMPLAPAEADGWPEQVEVGLQITGAFHARGVLEELVKKAMLAS